LPSTTHATDGDGLVGSCGAANTAPSGLSAAVTRSAVNGSPMGAPNVSGPALAVVVVVVGAGAAIVVEVV
jgi:hypothetical protein